MIGRFFHVSRPNTGIFSFDEEKADLLRKYVPISIEDAGWYSIENSFGSSFPKNSPYLWLTFPELW